MYKRQATEADNDAIILASTAALSVPEGGTASFTVRLAAAPPANVTVRLARTAGDSNISVDLGATLTFTTSNWNVGQTVRLRAANDSDSANGTAIIRATATGWTPAEVRATEADRSAMPVSAPSDNGAEEPNPSS